MWCIIFLETFAQATRINISFLSEEKKSRKYNIFSLLIGRKNECEMKYRNIRTKRILNQQMKHLLSLDIGNKMQYKMKKIMKRKTEETYTTMHNFHKIMTFHIDNT